MNPIVLFFRNKFFARNIFSKIVFQNSSLPKINKRERSASSSGMIKIGTKPIPEV